MKFTMNLKEFNAMATKVLTVIPTKSSFSYLEYAKLELENGILKMSGTDISQFLTVKNDDVYGDTEDGIAFIHMDDLKLASKLNGSEIEIKTIEEDKENNKALIHARCGKKTIKIPSLYDNEVNYLQENDSYKKSLEVSSLWFYETIVKLKEFTHEDEIRGVFHNILFSGKEQCAKAINTHMIGIREYRNNVKVYDDRDILLSRFYVPTLKKVLDSKTDETIEIMVGENDYILIKNDRFSLFFKEEWGEMPKTDRFFDIETPISFELKVNPTKDILKFDMAIKCDKKTSNPIILKKADGKLNAILVSKSIVMDELETNDLIMDDDFVIGLNMNYLNTILTTANTETISCVGKNAVTQLIFTSDDYKMLLLPVKINSKLMNTVSKI